MIKVLGIDPGLAATGIAFVVGKGIHIDGYSYGTICTSKELTIPNRLSYIYTEISELLLSEIPDIMVVEDVFSLPHYPKSGILLGQVIGVILLSASQKHIPIKQIPVREVKQVLTGYGNASKIQIERTVCHILNHYPSIRPYHASDAMALAITGLYRYEV
ncbi:MAG: crossover junction endodeoxyribonuclease RuvC [Desulfobacterales bacterium]|nr:crossover junction endodeoxyribonuclease RuvC [Desulfobacterales bacterium]